MLSGANAGGSPGSRGPPKCGATWLTNRKKGLVLRANRSAVATEKLPITSLEYCPWWQLSMRPLTLKAMSSYEPVPP